jgi:hypothetical protein
LGGIFYLKKILIRLRHHVIIFHFLKTGSFGPPAVKIIVKGIVSPDWKGLQMVSLDRFEV